MVEGEIMVKVAWASGYDAPWMPRWRGVMGMSTWEEDLGLAGAFLGIPKRAR